MIFFTLLCRFSYINSLFNQNILRIHFLWFDFPKKKIWLRISFIFMSIDTRNMYTFIEKDNFIGKVIFPRTCLHHKPKFSFDLLGKNRPIFIYKSIDTHLIKVQTYHICTMHIWNMYIFIKNNFSHHRRFNFIWKI